MILKEVHITGLWNKYNLEWKLNRSVNILSGINGVGKTTLLRIIQSLITNRTTNISLKKIRRAELLFSGGYSIEYSYEEQNGGAQLHYKHNANEITFEKFLTNIKIGTISTFDSRMPSLKEYQENIVTKGEKIRSQLDWKVERILTYYYKYVNSISQNVEKAISRNELDKLSLYYQKKNTFQALVNQMFSSTHKEICDTADGLMFRLEDGTLLAPHELSSGEKQLLILLIFALAENNQEFITLWDEPEISLHIDWQRKLINTVHMLNPNGQLIISTHSPSIIYEGWEKMVVNMEDLIHLQIPE